MSDATDTSADRAEAAMKAQQRADAMRNFQRRQRAMDHQRAKECARLWAERSANTQQEQQP